jgi:hypothetical protein
MARERVWFFKAIRRLRHKVTGLQSIYARVGGFAYSRVGLRYYAPIGPFSDSAPVMQGMCPLKA